MKEAEVIQVIRTVTENATNYVVKYFTLDGQLLVTATATKQPEAK